MFPTYDTVDLGNAVPPLLAEAILRAVTGRGE